MILENIKEERIKQLNCEREILPTCSLKSFISKNPREIIDVKKILNKDHITIIGEMKRASPSKGTIVSDYNLEEITKKYNSSSVEVISILTEERYFKGKNEDLIFLRSKTTLPILRKDFIISTYQIYHSYYLGADMILLIVALLSDDELLNFGKLAITLGLSVLIEVHTEEELIRVLNLNYKKTLRKDKILFPIIGVNNRDLNTFKVDLENSFKLINLIPKNILTISESGISTSDEIKSLRGAGFNGVLIGESILKGVLDV